MTDHNMTGIEFWQILSDQKCDNSIHECIDGKVLVGEEFLNFDKLDKKEKEAILKGFLPDNYYSAWENMQKAS